MKKYLLLFLLIFSVMTQAQTLQNPTYGTTALKLNVKQNNATRVIVQDSVTGKLNWVLKSSITDPVSYSKVVYVNTVNPNTATIFDLNNPPTVNDDLLKANVNNLYIGTDASTWVYNSTSLNYVTKIITSSTSNFYLSGTTSDAGGNKTSPIYRTSTVESTGFIATPETANTIASFDATKTIKSLSTATYPSLTELSYVKGLTSSAQTQINARALDNNVVHLSGNETRTGGTLTFKTTSNANANIVINPDNQSIKSLNTSGNTTWQILNTAVSQGGFNMGTPSAYIYGRNGGPLELGASISFIVPNATASTHALNKGQFDAVLLTLTSATLDFPSTSANTSSDLTIAYTGAVLGDIVDLGAPVTSVVANTSYTAFVSAAGVVTVRLNNYSTGSADPASGTFRVKILR